jgi:UDP-glucose 4-epimerase
MKVFGACAEAGVNKIIFKSSTAVYGAHSRNPGFLKEQHPLNGSRSYGTTRDLVEIEAFCNGFQAQYPQVALTILRFANIVGPTADTAITRYLREYLSPTLLGFDPMMQFIHEDDVVSALVSVVAGRYPGVFNLAAEDLMPLSKMLGLAGKPKVPIFHLFAYWGYGMVGGRGLRLSQHVPLELDYIRYRWVGDLARMRNKLNFEPTYTAEEALQEFASQRRKNRYMPEAITRAYDVDRLKGIIERRRGRAQERTDEDQGGETT